MKRSLLLAISALALTATSQQLIAAESETAAPQERAPRRGTPARTRPARAVSQRAAPQRPAAQSTQSSSFTGSQAGGFGGGNAGGGSFADPVALCQGGLSASSGLQPPCPGVPYTYPASHRIQGTGGATYGYSIPLFGWAVIGVVGEVAAGSIRSSNTQSNTHPTGPGFGPDLSARQTTETYSSSFNQGTNGSILVKFGVPVSIPLMLGKGSPGIITKDGISRSPYNASQNILIYGLIGTTFARVDGSYTYTGTNCPTIGLCTPLNSTTAYGAANWSQTRTGIATGVGAEWQFMPGVTMKLEYRYTSFGNISQDVPIAVTSVSGSPCIGSFCTSTAHIDIRNLNFQSVRLGVGFGL